MSDLIKREWWHYPAPAPRVLSDSDRNILSELAHEACETHCDECGRCIHEPDVDLCEGCTPAE